MYGRELVEGILGASRGQFDQLARGKAAGIIGIDPVVLPEQPLGDNNHMGWPVATKTGDTLVVVHRRIPGHNPRGAGEGDEDSTFSMSTYSDDGGETWSESVDLRAFISPQYRDLGGALPYSHRYKFGPLNVSRRGYKLHLNAIGTARDGAVLLLCNYGAFRSVDSGRSWTHHPEPFRDDLFPGDPVYLGPRIIDHPTYGLLAFGNTVGYGKSDSFPNPVDGPIDHTHHFLVILRSNDGGATWEKLPLTLPDWAAQHEPAALLYGNELYVIGRDQITGTDHIQMRLAALEEPVDTKRTNMRNLKGIDTVDLDFNPVTERFEVVRSRREKMRLELWSIDPADWDSAEWRLEGTLYSRDGDFYSSGDGFHPAGAVIDQKRGLQHIFIYTGHPNGPAGSFRLTRTLDTPKLMDFLAT